MLPRKHPHNFGMYPMESRETSHEIRLCPVIYIYTHTPLNPIGPPYFPWFNPCLHNNIYIYIYIYICPIISLSTCTHIFSWFDEYIYIYLSSIQHISCYIAIETGELSISRPGVPGDHWRDACVHRHNLLPERLSDARCGCGTSALK